MASLSITLRTFATFLHLAVVATAFAPIHINTPCNNKYEKWAVSSPQRRHWHQQRHPTLSIFSSSSSRSSMLASSLPISQSLNDNKKDNDVNQQQSALRPVARIIKYPRLPIWPLWNGIALFVISKLFGEDLAAKLEHEWGGRVCPNFFSEEQLAQQQTSNSSNDPEEEENDWNYRPSTASSISTTSPFLMLVHHCHSFHALDPLRYIQRVVFPEGFPAHPHRGFVTLTYILRGGFVHRDSVGVKQIYGNDDNDANSGRYKGKHSQWLKTGSGVLHEEMFDLSSSSNNPLSWLFQSNHQELYQLWINLPSSMKMTRPQSVLLGGSEDTPLVVEQEQQGQSQTIVLAGSYKGHLSAAPIESDMSILHVTMKSTTTPTKWTFDGSFETALLYMRRGSVRDVATGQIIGPHATAFFSPKNKGSIQLEHVNNNDPADFIFLAGEPLGEPVAAQGSMVMNTNDEINVAYMDYQRGRMGVPWEHTLSDDDWKKHLQQGNEAQQ